MRVWSVLGKASYQVRSERVLKFVPAWIHAAELAALSFYMFLLWSGPSRRKLGDGQRRLGERIELLRSPRVALGSACLFLAVALGVEVKSAAILATTGKKVAKFKFPARGAADALD